MPRWETVGRAPWASLVLAAGVLVSCARPKATEAPHATWGAAMAEVGRRFELLGRAAIAGRGELAKYQLGEVEEIFADTLVHADPPHEGHPAVLQPIRRTFLEANIPELRRALEARDRPTFDAAFARMATACNQCHQASGHGFIEVPTMPGATVPRLDPVP